MKNETKNDWIKKSVKNVLRQNFGKAALLLVLAVFIVFAGLVPPMILKKVIDGNLVPGKTEGLLLSAALYMGILIFAGVFDFVKEALLTVFGQKWTKEIRFEMMKKMEKIRADFFTTHSSGAVVSRFTNDVDAISVMFTGGLVGMGIDCFKIIGIVVSVWLFNKTLGGLTLLLLPVVFGITRLFQKRMLKAQIRNRILIGKVSNHLSESIKNILMIQSFSKERYMENKYKTQLLENYQTVEKVNFYDSIFPPVIQMIRAVVIALIVILAAGKSGFHGISLGMTAASIDLISNLFVPVENLGMELQNIQQAISGIRRVDDFFKEEEDGEKNADWDATAVLRCVEGITVEFRNLSFHYEEDRNILQHLNLRIEPCEKVTFAGRTGVGKTTLFKLITGVLKPAEGCITVNGVDVCSIPNTEKRKIFGYVDQGFPLIKGTVGDQISLKDPAVTRDQILRALEFTGLKDYVEALENGIDTPVRNESLFSRGQKQLLSIARAVVTNPPILLLDEITANLDSITEDKIVSVLQKAGAKHTILSISHRLSSLVACDKIVILENGKIKNVGTPQELLDKDEWYRSHIALEKLTWG